MAQKQEPAQRHEDLSAAINAAKARVAERRSLEWAEVGELLEGLSREITEIATHHHHDHDAAHSRYDRVEQRLGEVEKRLAAKGPGGG